MALTRVSGLSPNVSVAGSVTSDLVSTNLAQVGSATTIHTSGIDLGSGEITSHNIISTGIITAAQFVGDGSLLTGIAGGGGGGSMGIRVKDDGSLIGIAATVNFGTNLEATNYDVATSSVTINATGVSASLAIAYAVAL